MKILTVDIGTGTQDIFLYDSHLDLENGLKLVLPSPTMMVHRRLRAATRSRQAVLLHGVTMGGGPAAWAAEDHARAGLDIYATPDAARSFNDDLTKIAGMGIRVVSEDEACHLPDSVTRIKLADFDFSAIAQALEGFGVSLRGLAAVAVAVFDHGNAPAEISDRQFRFDYLDERIKAHNRLSTFAYRADQIPASMTRLQAVAASASQLDAPLLVMDTAPAAVLGASFDTTAAAMARKLIVNIGNFHTLGFRLGPSGLEGVFEHHTGLLNTPALEDLLVAFADGSLTREAVFSAMGHGALIYDSQPLALENHLVVTGPRRSLLRASRLRPYFAVPYGDMMIAGCFGLLAAAADLLPAYRESISASLEGAGGSGTPPWDVD